MTWDVDLGDIISEESTTNAVGEATATIKSTTNRETATVTVQAGNTVGYGYIEYAFDEDPTIIITTPLPNAQIGGFATVTIVARDTDADGSTGLKAVKLYVDSSPCGRASTDPERDGGLDTWALSNGPHVLRACATDHEGNVMWSQGVPVSIYNTVSELQLSQRELFSDLPNPGTFIFSGRLNEVGSWNLQITNSSGAVVFTDSGGQGPFQTTWDGKTSGNYVDGVYQATFTEADLTVKEVTTVSRSTLSASVLITGDVVNEKQWAKQAAIEEIVAVADACREQGLWCTIMSNPIWYDDETSPKRGMEFLLKQDYKYWFHIGHGSYFWDDTAGRYMAYVAFNDTGIQGDNYYLPIDRRTGYPAFSDLDLYPGHYRMVMINTCWSAGSYLPWQSIDPTIAGAFKIWNEPDQDRSYLGWTTRYSSNWPFYGTAWTKEFWHYLGLGYTVSQSIFWANWNIGGSMRDFLYVQGGPSVTYLTRP